MMLPGERSANVIQLQRRHLLHRLAACSSRLAARSSRRPEAPQTGATGAASCNMLPCPANKINARANDRQRRRYWPSSRQANRLGLGEPEPEPADFDQLQLAGSDLLPGQGIGLASPVQVTVGQSAGGG